MLLSNTNKHFLRSCWGYKPSCYAKKCQQWENTNQTKTLFIFSLALGTSNHVTVDVMCIHSYNMGDKIREMSINVAFEYICQKEWSCLTYGRTVYNVSNLTWLWLSSKDKICNILAHLIKTMRSRKCCYEQTYGTKHVELIKLNQAKL